MHCKPFEHTRKRQSLQINSPRIDRVCVILELGNREIPSFVGPELGYNYCETPCTDWGAVVTALVERQRILQTDRPWRIAERHLRGYTKSVEWLYGVVRNTIRVKEMRLKSCGELAETYDGTKRAHYRQCAAELKENPLTWRRRREIYHDPSGKWGELTSRPRVLLVQTIRARGAAGVKPGTPLRAPILIEGRYRAHVETSLHYFMSAHGHEMVASGMDLYQRGRTITKYCQMGYLVLSCDWKSFDGSLGQLGVVERDIFLRTMERTYGDDEALRAVIWSQNFCTIQGGPVSARMYGNRGSGTAGTSAGNKMVVLSALHYALGPALHGANSCQLLCDGDDTLIFVPPVHRPYVKSWVRRLTELGLQTKVEQEIENNGTDDQLSCVRFCRAGVINTQHGPFLCKKPDDMLKVATNIRRHFRGPRFKDYLATLGVGYSNAYGHVPIMGAVGEMFAIASPGGKSDRALMENAGLEYMVQRQPHKTHQPLTMEDRLSFHKTFGVTPQDQILCEMLLRQEGARLRSLLSSC